MNTKQLIDELNSECILTKLEKKEITELLQRGETFEEMWKEFKKKFSDNSLTTFDNNEYITHRVENFMDEFQQKYFPQPIKKYITIEVEANTEEGVECGMEDIKEIVDKMEYPKLFKMKILKGGK